MKKIYSLLILITSIVLTVGSLLLFVTSYSYYQDEYGTSISFEEDYVILLIGAVLFLFLSIYRYAKQEEAQQLYTNLVMIAESALIGFYPLGKFIKAFAESFKKDADPFVFKDNQFLLYMGLVGICLLAASIVKYLCDKKTKGNSLEEE